MKSIIVFIFLSFGAHAQSNSIELGDVHWLRSLKEAQVKSRNENKPILILFQEVPGCQTCRKYGSDVLTQPLIVEAIESLFIPLAIFNNKGGTDLAVLKRFHEPAWNNPVVRIIDAQGTDLVPRLNGNYSAAGLSGLMTNALIQQKGKAPTYLQLLTEELTARHRGTAIATYSMYCFWTGEALFGKINGVVHTTAGFQNGSEVVEVTYDPAVIRKTDLDQIAQNQKCKAVSNGNIRPDNTPKYYLSHSRYKNLPMTEIQKCRVNSALAEGQDPREFLSDRQLRF